MRKIMVCVLLCAMLVGCNSENKAKLKLSSKQDVYENSISRSLIRSMGTSAVQGYIFDVSRIPQGKVLRMSYYILDKKGRRCIAEDIVSQGERKVSLVFLRTSNQILFGSLEKGKAKTAYFNSFDRAINPYSCIWNIENPSYRNSASVLTAGSAPTYFEQSEMLFASLDAYKNFGKEFDLLKKNNILSRDRGIEDACIQYLMLEVVDG